MSSVSAIFFCGGGGGAASNYWMKTVSSRFFALLCNSLSGYGKNREVLSLNTDFKGFK